MRIRWNRIVWMVVLTVAAIVAFGILPSVIDMVAGVCDQLNSPGARHSQVFSLEALVIIVAAFLLITLVAIVKLLLRSNDQRQGMSHHRAVNPPTLWTRRQS